MSLRGPQNDRQESNLILFPSLGRITGHYSDALTVKPMKLSYLTSAVPADRVTVISSAASNTSAVGLHRSVGNAFLALVFAVGVVLAIGPVANAQELDAAEAPSASDLEPVRTEMTQFAPGIVNVIAPAPHPQETFTGPMTLQSLIDAHPEIEWGAPNFTDGRPNYDPRTRTLVEMARQVTLRREVYSLEFSFKPLRMIYLDVPQPNGRMARKLVWYMVYRVRYRGGDLRPAADMVGQSPIYKRVEAVSYDSRRAFPMLVLEDFVADKKYLDRVLPTAKQRIAVREQITAPLYDSLEITSVNIPLSSDPDAPGVWGVATWEDIDPNTDFFSVYIYGLTNAFQQEGEGDDAPYKKKALRLNFYRPGDTINQLEDEIRFGVPAHQDPAEQNYVLQQFGLETRLDYEWVFR
jgi:hypothetical protein